MKTVISSVKGTRDFYPEEMGVRNWLYGKLRKVSDAFGYQEYDGPFLETMELYAAKSGEELVKDQSYAFKDRGGDEITLRPELTPSVVRMIAQRQQQLVYPLRWWSFGPFWRYEKPQKGRVREFFQWNIDLIGVDSPEADAELLAVIASFFREVGLKPGQVSILVNNRRLMEAEMAALGIAPEARKGVSNWIDRQDKLSPEAWDAYGADAGMNPQQLAGMKAVLSSQELWRKSEELTRLFAALKVMGVSDYVRFDPNIVRGLLYYTGTVFEAFDLSGSLRRAILGGGRYDNLMAAVGGDPMPGVGFAMGDVVISLVLKELGLVPQGLGASPAQALVTVFDAERQPVSLATAAALRQAGLNVICYPDAAKLPKQFKYADRLGVRVVIVIGPDEAANGQVTVKDLRAGTQQTVPGAEAAALVAKILQ